MSLYNVNQYTETTSHVLLPRKRTLLQNDHYIVIDKPPDLRMDSDVEESVQRLLISLIPNTTKDNFKWVHQLDYATSGG